MLRGTVVGHFGAVTQTTPVPIQEIKARLGHASIETTARYLAELTRQGEGVGDVLDRRHEAQQRQRRL